MAFNPIGVGAVSVSAQGGAVTPAYGTGNRDPLNLLTLQVTGTGASTQPGTPAGWSLGIFRAGISSSATVFYKIATGGDAAPTVAGSASVTWSCRLQEFQGGAGITPVDQSGMTSGTTSPQTATFGGADAAIGELLVAVGTGFYSVAGTKAAFAVTTNHGTMVEVDNLGTNTNSHYSFGYALTTSNTGADTAILTFTTTSITGAVVAGVSFKLDPSRAPARAQPARPKIVRGFRGLNTVPVASQVAPPNPTMTQFGTSPRRLAGIPLPRGHQTMPVPAQLNPPLNDKRRVPSFKRIVPQAKGKQSLAAPPQLNPPLSDPRRLAAFKRLLRPTRGRTAAPVQNQAPPPNPAITQLGTSPRRLAGMLLRRGRQVTPVPAQVNPPIVLATRRPRAGGLGARRAQRPPHVPAQDRPLFGRSTTARRSPLTSRPRRNTPTPSQDHLTPARPAKRRLVAFRTRQVRRPVPTAQTVVPTPTIIGNRSPRRLAGLLFRLGRRLWPVPPQPGPGPGPADLFLARARPLVFIAQARDTEVDAQVRSLVTAAQSRDIEVDAQPRLLVFSAIH